MLRYGIYWFIIILNGRGGFMFKVGDKVKILSVGEGIDKIFINRIGYIDKIDPKSYYPYHVRFEDIILNEEARYLWWNEENLTLTDEKDPAKVDYENLKCLRCGGKMKFLKEYRFDTQKEYRDFISTIIDYEEAIVFNVYVCEDCRHTEFFFVGIRTGIDV